MRSWMVALILFMELAIAAPAEEPEWKIFVANDNCPDYTWGYSEEVTRKAFADVVRGHLDAMAATDSERPENRARYNAAVTQEVLCFLELYPDRKEELVRRVREGRLYVSPFLCNSLWGLQSFEALLRTLYPARRLEREWGVRIQAAHHIECPSLPWGAATVLQGCGIHYLSVPYLNYDCTFAGMKTAPVFAQEGPDGSRVLVVLDHWASQRANYTQGAAVLRKPDSIATEWIPHYQGLGPAYPLRTILASGTHGDISPTKGAEARGFADAIARYNERAERPATIVNATFPMFWEEVEKAVRAEVFEPVPIRGSLGHSWEAWPVSLAKHVAAMRQGERRFLAAESLIAIASLDSPAVKEATRRDRERAEWCWAMLSDHAWNGTNDENKRQNAALRQGWARDLQAISSRLLSGGVGSLGLSNDRSAVTLFNPASFARNDIVRLERPVPVRATLRGVELSTQTVTEDGLPVTYVAARDVLPYALDTVGLEEVAESSPVPESLHASPERLESPFYRVVPDPETGAVASLIHKPSGQELVATQAGRQLLQTVYHDGTEHPIEAVVVQRDAVGAVLARLQMSGRAGPVRFETFVTVYAELDRVDFDVRIEKPRGDKPERLCHAFPLLGDNAVLRVATAGAVVRPRTQPEGDLVAGADTRRFACSDYFSVSNEAVQVTVVPLDAFLLRLDQGPPMIEALGNDQNHREVLHDQDGETSFRFRYSLSAQVGGYDGPAAAAFARSVAAPLLVLPGRISSRTAIAPVSVDPSRAVATCLKPADGSAADGIILRLWETAGHSGSTPVRIPGFSKAWRTDILERDLAPLDVDDGVVRLDLPPHGYASVRFVR